MKMYNKRIIMLAAVLSGINLLMADPLLAQQAMIKGRPAVNQAGYNLLEAKRFTVPGSPDGTVFTIYHARDTLEKAPEVLYSGIIKGYVGDFSAFNPETRGRKYVIEVKGNGRSVPFRVDPYLMQNLSSRLAYQFFIDVRGGFKTDLSPANVTGGGPSRDGGGSVLEATFEGLLYASNPALFDRWTNELKYYNGKRMWADFPPEEIDNYSTYVITQDSTVKDPGQTPDLIKLLLWHAEFAYKHLAYNELAGGGFNNWKSYNKIRMFGYEGDTLQSFDYQNMLDQLAAVCAYYHLFLKPYLDEATYLKYRQACLENWELYDRDKEVRYWVRSFKWIDKGYREFNEQGNAFGQGLLRNMFMYIGELHEEEGDPERFLDYAVKCAEDIVENWDFNDPWHMWAMRNAEHITPQALTMFYLMFPDKAPAGTLEKLQAYRDYVLERTANLWQYRTHSDTEWAHRKSKEVGTVAGLGGSFFAVSGALQDEKLQEIGWSQVNFLFGCNPAYAHLSNKSAARVALKGYWEGVEVGWPHPYVHGTGELGLCRGTLDGSPTNHAFPFDPDSAALADAPGVYGTEGWSLTNRAWMSTVAFSTMGSHQVQFIDGEGNSIEEARTGEEVIIELRAALNQHDTEAEMGWVLVGSGNKPEKIIVRETGPNSGIFRATYEIPPSGAKKLSASYGYLAFRKSAEIMIKQ